MAYIPVTASKDERAGFWGVMIGFYIVLALCILGIAIGSLPHNSKGLGQKIGESEGHYSSRMGQYRWHRNSRWTTDEQKKLIDEYEAKGWALDKEFYKAGH